MLNDIAFALWFMLPAAVANAAPIFSAAIPGLRSLNAPIDGGKKYKGRRLLGSHKTWRGIASGIIAATCVLGMQKVFANTFGWSSFFTGSIDYNAVSLLLGPVFALGALGGDAIESFIKRRRSIESGRAWVPFDQLDYIIGSIFVTMPFVFLSVKQYVWIVVIWFMAHILASFIGYKIGLKKDPI